MTAGSLVVNTLVDSAYPDRVPKGAALGSDPLKMDNWSTLSSVRNTTTETLRGVGAVRVMAQSRLAPYDSWVVRMTDVGTAGSVEARVVVLPHS